MFNAQSIVLSCHLVPVFLMGRRLHAQPHEQRGEHREDVGLQKGDKQFQEVDANDEPDREHGDDV